MKKATRQLVLLIGVMTILTGTLVTINTAGTEPPEPDLKENPPPEETSDMINPAEKGNFTDNTTKINESSQRGGLVGQSIEGWKLLWEDIKWAITALPIGESNEEDQS